MKIFIYALLLLLSSGCSLVEIPDFEGDFDFSVMSFNLRYDEPADGDNQWDNRKEAVLTMINEVQPTIIGIQEGLHHQVRFLDDNLSSFQYVGVGRDDGHSSGEYAAIFYATDYFELLEADNFWLSETPESPSLGWDANNIRICTWAKLKDISKGEIIYIFNTHFDHKGKTAQQQSSELLAKKIHEIAEADASIFITGDFNMLIGNKRLNPLTENYFTANHFAEISDDNKSFNAWGRGILSRNIDFIFYQNTQAVAYKTLIKNYGVPYISDHYPIISYFNHQ